jgi:hypothetical protein
MDFNIKHKILVVGCDSNYFRLARLCLSSFRRLHTGWTFKILDVGLTAGDRDKLSKFGEVVTYGRDAPGKGYYVPSAVARLDILTRWPAEDTVMVYADADILFLGSYEATVERFLASGKPLGLFREPTTLHNAGDHCKPYEPLLPLFPHIREWYNEGALSTAVVIAGGPAASQALAFGKKCLDLWPQVRPFAMLGEQSVVNYVAYEDKLPYCPLTEAEMCVVWHYNLRSESSLRYGPTDRVTLRTGEPVLARHFVGAYKKYLYDHLDRLEQEYGVV